MPPLTTPFKRGLCQICLATFILPAVAQPPGTAPDSPSSLHETRNESRSEFKESVQSRRARVKAIRQQRRAERRNRPRPHLEEVIVTAQKREEDAQSVPLSVTALSGSDIVDKNMADMNEVANHVPNLDVLAVPTFPSVYMRGLGSAFNRGFEQSVAILIDEVYYGRASYINQGLMDLAAIEVMRGPQGTLFGKNASAGAIHFRSAQPEYDFGVKGDVLLGEDNLRRYRLSATGPLLDDKLAWRVAVLSDNRDGSVHNTTTGVDEENRDTQAARMRLQWDISDNLSAGVIFNGSVVEQLGPGSQLTHTRGRALGAMKVFDPQTTGNPYDSKSHQDYRSGTNRESWDSTLKVDWTLGNDNVLTSISNITWQDEDVSFDADFSPVPFLVMDNDEDLRQFSQELRLTSAPGKVEYVAGLYYLETDMQATYDITELLLINEILQVTGEGERILCLQTPDPKSCQDAVIDDELSGTLAGQTIQTRIALEGGVSPVEQALTRFDQLTRSAALFGQLTWHATDHLSLTFGSRVNHEEKTLNLDHILLNNRTGQSGNATTSGSGPLAGYGLGSNPLGSLIFPVIVSGETQFSAKRKQVRQRFIPKFSAQYNFSDDVMTYLTIAEGFKSGGYNAQPTNTTNLEFDDEQALTYELGIKSDWLDGAARLNISAFRTEFDNLQVASFNGVSYIVNNAAAAIVQGVEYEAMMLNRLGMLFSINGAYTDAKYSRFEGGTCQAEVTDTPPCDLSGHTLRLVPELKTTLTVGYRGQPFDLPFVIMTGINATYNTEVFLTTDLDPIDVRGEGTTYNMQLGIRAVDDSWYVTVFGDNLSDRKYLAGSGDAPAFRGNHFGGAYLSTNFDVEIGLRF